MIRCAKVISGKLRSNKGETLIETVVSLVIITMAVLMLCTMTIASGDLNNTGAIMENNNYVGMSGAEVAIKANRDAEATPAKTAHIVSQSGGITVDDTIKINIYKSKEATYSGELKSYDRQ